MSPIAKPFPGADVLDPLHLLHRPLGVHLQNFRMRQVGEICGAAEQARQLRDPARMVGVLVGDQNGVNALRAAAVRALQNAEATLSCPSPASMRRVVCSVSSNVQLPVLPEARMEMRNEMRLPQSHLPRPTFAPALRRIMAKFPRPRQSKPGVFPKFAGRRKRLCCYQSRRSSARSHPFRIAI